METGEVVECFSILLECSSHFVIHFLNQFSGLRSKKNVPEKSSKTLVPWLNFKTGHFALRREEEKRR